MPLNQVALVPYRAKKVQFREIAIVAAALQRQVTRDFGPIWGADATVDAFASLEDVPLGYWPIVICDTIGTSQLAGFHEDRMGQPYSLVKSAGFWSLAASHECLEMLADPWGNRVISGWRPPEPKKLAGSGKGRKHEWSTRPELKSRRVEYLVEVCDACEGPPYGYLVNGVLVSDFYTPDYFNAQHLPGVRYDFQGHIKAPRTVLPGGYLSWHDPELRKWVQLQYFDREGAALHAIIASPGSASNIRAWIDSKTPRPQEELTVDDGDGVDHGMVSVYEDGPWTLMLGDGPDHGMHGEAKPTNRAFWDAFRGVVYREVAEAQARDAKSMEELIDQQLKNEPPAKRAKKRPKNK
jgi:hypothetical protein